MMIRTQVFFLLMSVTIHANPSVSPVVSPVASPIIVASPTPALEPIKEEDKKKLLSEFQKALSTQKSARVHQEKITMRDFYASQKSKLKKWRENKKSERKVFFETHHSGAERRTYVQAYLKEKELFDASIQAETVATRKTWSEKTAALKTEQKEKEAKFNALLSQGLRPPTSLWPTSN